MDTMTYTAARAHLSSIIDKVVQDREPVVIRKKQAAVVMMSLEDFEAWSETVYLQTSPANARRLTESIRSLEQGEGVVDC